MERKYDSLEVAGGNDGVFTVTINRPDVLNSLNDATVQELDLCFDQLGRDREVRLVIVTGAGEKAFVAGADISELAEQDPVEARRRARSGQRAFGKIEELGKPVLAAINGFALGGGCELALACHLRYASSRARLGLPEVSLGIIPGYGGTQRLQRIVGRGRALEWILTGDMISADEAYRIGLVNGVFSPEELLSGVESVAKKILSRGPIAVQYAIEAVLRGGESTLAEGLALEADLFGLISSTRDMREGMAAFLEKRKPEFRAE